MKDAPIALQPVIAALGRDLLLDRFMLYVEQEPNSGCWLWTGGISGNGYGNFKIRSGMQRSAHRVAYSLFVGDPDAPTLDHTCRVRRCVNPEHLEPVSGRENVRRGNTIIAKHLAKNTCPQGHKYDAVFRLKRGSTYRACRQCERAKWHRWNSNRKASAQGGS